MIEDFIIHGRISEKIEYYAAIAGKNISDELYSFEIGGKSGPYVLRLFSRGNEIVLGRESITHHGNGGIFCEYMFGVDLPIEDLTKSEVLNRLILFGVYEEAGSGIIRFSNRTTGEERYEEIFMDGNAIANYYFFVSTIQSGGRDEIQKRILRAIGKELKRLPFVGRTDQKSFAQLIEKLKGYLRDLSGTLFIVKLVHERNALYYEESREFYLHSWKYFGGDEFGLVARARELGVEPYTRERVKVDIFYKHPDNKAIIDEYKEILIEASAMERVPPNILARLDRLRTLAVRNNIPETIMKALDQRFPINAAAPGMDEKAYIREARSILEGLFLSDRVGEGRLDNKDIVRLVEIKHAAALDHETLFEQMLLETSRKIDEVTADDDELNISKMENFSFIISLFDRYDACSQFISRLAFMGEGGLTEERIRSLRIHKDSFDEVDPGLFQKIFFDKLFKNRYLTRFGREKISALLEGMEAVCRGDASYRDVIESLGNIVMLEEMHNAVCEYLRRRPDVLLEVQGRRDTADARRRVTAELSATGAIERPVSPRTFSRAVQAIVAEKLYTKEVLPEILRKRDSAFRLDFIANSGLDLFEIEELEKDYLVRHKLPADAITRIIEARPRRKTPLSRAKR